VNTLVSDSRWQEPALRGLRKQRGETCTGVIAVFAGKGRARLSTRFAP